jgi:hypothetical protein
VKDLRSRCYAFILFLALGTLVGCASLEGGPRQKSGSGSNSLSVITPELDFGTVVIGRTKVLNAVIANRSVFGVTITEATVSGPEFQILSPQLPMTIQPGEALTLQIQFTPQGAGSASGLVAISTNTQVSTTFMLSGQAVTAGQVAAVPPNLSFGSVAIGQKTTKTGTFTNSGSTSLTVSSLTVSNADFQLSGITVPFTLDPGQSQTYSVIFSPKAAGASTGSIAINSAVAMTVYTRNRWHSQVVDTQADSMTVPLSGTGTTAATGQLTLSPTSVSFGTVQLNATTSKTVVLQNTGTASVSISQAVVSGAGFSMAGLNAGTTVAAGQSASFTVTYSPTTSGNAAGNVAITSNASNGSLNLGLIGTSATPGLLTAGSSIMAFGTVQVGSNQKQTATVTNSGGSSVTISQASLTGAGFTLSGITTPMTLSAGQSTTFSVMFAPSVAGNAAGSVTLSSNATGSPLTWTLSGSGVTAGALTSSPSSLSFGSVQTGSNKTLQETLTNTGGTAVKISQVSASGAYTVTGLTLPLTVNAGSSASFNVVFTPTTGGSANSSLAITSDASNPSLSVPLSGSGSTPGALAASTPSLSFGSVVVGNNQSLSETITNNGGSSVTVSQVSVTGAGFSLSGITLPFTLAAGANKSFSVVFTPTTSGTPTGALAITSDASNPSLAIALSGTAVTAGAITAGSPSLSFGSVVVGSNQTLSETVTNNGGSSVTISQATATGTGFSLSGISVPFTLAAGAGKSFNVVFAPTAAGTPTGSVTLTSNASNPTLSIPLSGTATTAGALVASTPSLSFGSVLVNDTQTLSETVTNNGGSSVTISQATATGTGFSVSGLTLPLTLAAGASTSFNVVFAPTTAGTPSGSLTITSNASNPSLTVSLSGTATAPGTLSASPTSLSFGSVQVGSSSTKSQVLSNTGGSSVAVSQVNATGTGYSLSGISLPMTLNAGQNFTFNVIFTPQSSGSATGSIAVVSNASNNLPAITLTGSGAAAGTFAVSPTSFAFGSVIVGTSKNMTATLSASGSSVTVNSASVSSAEFTLTGPALPLTIAAGQTATFTLQFRPQSAGTASATVSFSTNASGSPLVESLTGTGTAAPQHRVDLSWSPSSSTVAGYNVYRSTTSGSSYSKINSGLNADTSYSDSSVVAGSTYFYVTTAVDSGGVESSFSNQVQAVIPTP